MKYAAIIFVLVLTMNTRFSQEIVQETYPPKGFVYVHTAIPDILYDIRYAGSHNFIGQPIQGYESHVALLSNEAADALKQVQQDLKAEGYQLKIFDAYRPQRAVNNFMQWAKDEKAISMKQEFYPEVDKSDLFRLGYIAEKSGHTRGSTIDVTLVYTESGKEVDMGSPYDFFGEKSHHGSQQVSSQQETNRNVLKKAMENAGFKALPEEWWHYSLENEPYPETYFDFPVK